MEVHNAIRTQARNMLSSSGLQYNQVEAIMAQLEGNMSNVIQYISQLCGGQQCSITHINEACKVFLDAIIKQLTTSNYSTLGMPQYQPQVQYHQTNPFAQMVQPQQQVKTHFGNNNSGISLYQSSYQQPQVQQHQPTQVVNTPIQQEEPPTMQEEKWEISDKKDKIVDSFDVEIYARPTTRNGSIIKNLYINLAGVPTIDHIVNKVNKYIEDRNKPFVAQIETQVPVIVGVEPSIINNLYATYQEHGLCGGEITTNRSPVSTKIAVDIIKVAFEYMESIKSGDAKKLEAYFVDMLNALIYTHLISPTTITKAVRLPELKYLSEFYEGDRAHQLSNYEHFASMRDIIVCGVLRDSISPARICSWDNLIDRSIMIMSDPNKVFSNGMSMSQYAISKDSDFGEDEERADIETLFADNNITIIKRPIFMIHTNILDQRMRYAYERLKFNSYAFNEAQSLIEAILIDQQKIKDFAVINVEIDDFHKLQLTYGAIIDGSTRVAIKRLDM